MHYITGVYGSDQYRPHRIALLLVALGLVAGLVTACDTGLEIAGDSSRDWQMETWEKYRAIADSQYEAMKFMDAYVEGQTSRLGKRVSKTGMRRIIRDAHVELLARRGYSQKDIGMLIEHLEPHWTYSTRVYDARKVSTVLTKRGFSEDQIRYVRIIQTSARGADSYQGLRIQLQNVMRSARGELADEQLEPILALAASLDGLSVFLEEKGISQVRSELSAVGSLTSAKTAGPSWDAECIRGPEQRNRYHQPWRYSREAILTGMAFCGFGTAIGGLGCGPAGIFGFGAGLYWQYYEAEDKYINELRQWCDKCVFSDRSPRSGILRCHVEFLGDYPRVEPPRDRNIFADN